METFSEMNSSTISRRTATRPLPFNLSRSNSRRTKHVLVKEKLEKEERELEEFA